MAVIIDVFCPPGQVPGNPFGACGTPVRMAREA